MNLLKERRLKQWKGFVATASVSQFQNFGCLPEDAESYWDKKCSWQRHSAPLCERCS